MKNYNITIKKKTYSLRDLPFVSVLRSSPLGGVIRKSVLSNLVFVFIAAKINYVDHCAL